MKTRENLMFSLRHTPIVAVSAAVVAMCPSSHAGENKDRQAEKEQPNIVAGPHEETFAERYHLSISLPMPERAFLDVLRRLTLSYELVGRSDTFNGILSPIHSHNLDLSKMQRCYQINGGGGKIYRAYVDRDDRVVYIENSFIYPIP